MKVLMISTDRKIFEENSDVRQRILEYGNLVDGLYVVVLSKESHFEKRLIGNNTWLYPTNSRNKLFYIFDAIRIGRKIIGKNLNKEKWLVTTQDPFETGLIGWWIAKTKRAKLHLQVHTDFLSWGYRLASPLNKTRSQLAMFLITQADGVRTVSKRIKDSIVKRRLKKAEKISVLPIFVDVERIRNSEPQIDLRQKYSKFDFIILTASRLEKEKNISMMIDIMKEVVKEYPKTGLVIVGEGSLRDVLSKKVLKKGLQNNVVFEGWQNDLISYYKTADLFLLTSSYEGYGLVLLEAAVAGCPVLTSDVGLVGGVLKEGSVAVCGVGKKKCFVEKILNMLGNRSILSEMVAKAQSDVEDNVLKSKEQYLMEYKKDWEKCF